MPVSTSTGVLNSLLGKLATLMGEEYAKLKGVRKQVPDDPFFVSCILRFTLTMYFTLYGCYFFLQPNKVS